MMLAAFMLSILAICMVGVVANAESEDSEALVTTTFYPDDDTVTVNESYSKTISGPGLLSAETYTLSGASWLSIQTKTSSTITLTGTPTSTGTFNVSVVGPFGSGAGTATWEWAITVESVPTYTLSIVGHSGSVVYTVSVASGSSATLPTASTLENGISTNYNFQGYYTTSTTSGTYVGTNGSSVTLTADKTIYAVWTAKTYTHTLSYNANTGSGAPSTQSVTNTSSTYAMSVSQTVPTKMGYTFVGWGTSASATTPVVLQGGTVYVSTSVTLYAIWEAVTETYEPPNDTITVSESFTKSVAGTGILAKSYYSLAGASWLTISSTTSTSITVSGTPTATGTYTAIITGPFLQGSGTATWTWTITVSEVPTYTLSIVGHSGSVVYTVSVTSGGSVSLPDASTLENAISDHYNFEGYYSTSNINSTYIGTTATSLTLTADKTIYAIWTDKVYYEITMDFNGYYFKKTMQAVVVPIYSLDSTYEDGEIIDFTIAENYIGSYEFYDSDGNSVRLTFVGWSLSSAGNVISGDVEAQDNTTYYAIFTDAAIKPIAYFNYVVQDLVVTFSDQSRGGYVWNWDFGDTTTSTAKSPEHTYSEAGTYVVTLILTGADSQTSTISKSIAVGTDTSATYTISYDYNGGVGDPGSVSGLGGSYIILPDATMSGYTFAGWYQNEIFVGNPGSEYEISDNATLVASYVEGTVERFTVTFVDHNVTINTQTVISGGIATDVRPTSENGFSGWLDSTGQAYQFNTKVTGSMTLTAYYQKETSDISGLIIALVIFGCIICGILIMVVAPSTTKIIGVIIFVIGVVSAWQVYL